ncbi:Nif11 family protein [Kitasatospora sp. NPDC058965]|uniref:Nif11 family protein n=1 Tax=Kitasatospora sp. NPDC058965 TaxID=3346682 RepID=UPI0036CC3121
MSRQSFADFLTAVAVDPVLLERYDRFSLAQLTFHAKNAGYQFDQADIEAVVGALEITTILEKDRQEVDGNAVIWREMWGVRHLAYLATRVRTRFTDEEFAALVAGLEGAAA